jgi:hypothetical protein
MKPLFEKIDSETVNGTVPLHPAHRRKGIGNDLHPQMRFAASIMMSMACMQMALVYDLEALRRKVVAEALRELGGYSHGER